MVKLATVYDMPENNNHQIIESWHRLLFFFFFTGIIFSSFPTSFIFSVTPCLLATPSFSHPLSSFIPDSAWWWCMACPPGIHSNGLSCQSSPPERCGWTDRSASGCSSRRRCPPARSTGLGCTRHFSGPVWSCCRLQGRGRRWALFCL